MAGERSGNLDGVLRRFVQYLRLNQSLKKKAISASVYPLVLLAMMTVLVVVMLVYVIPQFQGFYEGLGAELPLPTKVVMGLAVGFRSNLPWILLALGIGRGRVAGTGSARDASGAVMDRALLRLPYLGRLMRMYATSQLARTLSTLLAGRPAPAERAGGGRRLHRQPGDGRGRGRGDGRGSAKGRA